MAAEGGAIIITFIFNCQHRRDIPRDVTHLVVHESVTVIPARLFCNHPNLIEVYCHPGVTKIEEWAFSYCRSLRRVIIPDVTDVEAFAFYKCTNIEYVECDKLETIGEYAFCGCKSLSSINLPSAKIVEPFAFDDCTAMTQAIFGKDLESIEGRAFICCNSLESVTIPLKNGMLADDCTFKGCVNLKRVNLVEGEALRDFTDALLLGSWKKETIEVLDSINDVLPNADPGGIFNGDGGKAIAIREWIESVLRKVTHYKSAHRDLLNEAAIALQLSLPNDAVMNNVLPFVELPALVVSGDDVAD